MKFLSILHFFIVAANAALTYKGIDWSSLLIEEAAGKSYKNSSGLIQPLENILKSSGVNTVRQRLWVNPANGDYNLDYNLKLARRAKAAGLTVYLDLHYSDTWADPDHQAPPSGWPTDIDGLASKVQDYTLSVCNSFAAASIPLPIISIGNEIRSGLLWPLGKWPLGSTPSYNNIARLIHSASVGIKASNLPTKPKIMLHLDNGWDWEAQNFWYHAILTAGPLASADFDMIGVTYYPSYDTRGTLGALKTSLMNLASTYKKQLVVAETNWPVLCPNPTSVFPSDTLTIPISIAGQKIFMKDLASLLASVNGGVGLFYWESMWIQSSNLGSGCDDILMVEQNGNVRSSLSEFGNI